MKIEETKTLKKNLPLFAILFLFGIIFLIFSEYNQNTKNESQNEIFDSEAYTENLELRLEEMIGSMEGISDVNVMVVLEGSERYLWSSKTAKNLDEKTANSASAILAQNANETDSPILLEKGAPKIRGVSVVCKGVKNSQTKQKVIGLLSGTLNLNTNQIYVSE